MLNPSTYNVHHAIILYLWENNIAQIFSKKNESGILKYLKKISYLPFAMYKSIRIKLEIELF